MTSFADSVSIVFVEGGIGCGKSTLVKHIQEYCEHNKLRFLTIQEPVDIWTEIKNEEGVNMIEAFYQDQSKHGFTFQMMAYISRLQRIQDAIETAKTQHYDFIICERSLYTDKHVFCKMLYDEGKIDAYGYQIYNKWFDCFQSFMKNAKFVYLRADYNVCFERVQKRQRIGETSIAIDYLQKNNAYHDEWLLKHDKDHVMILDGNKDCDMNPHLHNEYCKKIMEYLK